VVAVQYRRPNGTVGLSVGTDTIAYSPEYRDLKSNSSLLEQIARLTGGRQQPSPQDIFGAQRAPVRVPSEASIPLLFVVLFLLPVDIALRRIVWQAEVLPEWQQAWARVLARLRVVRTAPSSASATSQLLQRKRRLREKYEPPAAGVPSSAPDEPTTAGETTTSRPVSPQPSTSSEQIGRLLDAKKRTRKEK